MAREEERRDEPKREEDHPHDTPADKKQDAENLEKAREDKKK